MPKRSFLFAACSNKFSMFISSTGTLFTCGTSKYGEMGCYSNQITYIVETPVQVPDIPRVSDVSCGEHHTIAILCDSKQLYGWGNPQNGRLGMDLVSKTSVPTPQVITPNTGKIDIKPRFLKVNCANVYSLALDEDRFLWYTGIKRFEPNSKGEEVVNFTKGLVTRKPIQLISTGPEFTFFLDDSEVVFFGERKLMMQLDNKAFHGNEKNVFMKQLKTIDKERRVPSEDPKKKDIVLNGPLCLNICAGYSQAAYIENGRIYVWGNTEKGKLGLAPDQIKDRKNPTTLENFYQLKFPKELLIQNVVSTEIRTEKKIQDSMIPINNLQLTLKNLPKSMNLGTVYQEDNTLANYFDNVCPRYIDNWREVKSLGYKNKVFLKLMLNIIFKKGKERLKRGLTKNLEAINGYLRNIMVYEKIFGLLYLQPFYIFRLLTCPDFSEGEKLFKLIKNLYLSVSGSSTKNLTYLMILCLTLLQHDRKVIVKRNLQATILDNASLKVYSMIVMGDPVVVMYFEELKKMILEDIIKFAAEKNQSTVNASSYQNAAKMSQMARSQLVGQSLLAQSLSKNAATSGGDFLEEDNKFEKDVFLATLDNFLQRLAKDFKKIDINNKIIPVSLVNLNKRVYDDIRNAKIYKSKEDRRMFLNLLKSFMVELFFKNMFEKLLTKDHVWESIVEDKKKSVSEHTLTIISDIVNLISVVFQKRSEDSNFDKYINEHKSTLSKQEQKGASAFQYRIKDVIDLAFLGIAEKNSTGFDISEINLKENLMHTFSDHEDVLTLTSGEINIYKELLIDIYQNRDKYKPFLSPDEKFVDPLRTLLSYINQDEMNAPTLEISDEAISINLNLRNKFFEILNPEFDKSVMRRCSTTDAILPKYLLQEDDRVWLYEVKNHGWPCVIKDRASGLQFIHHHNDILDTNCKGYSIETKTVQKRCDQYINEASLRASSAFTKISMYSLFPNDTEEISMKVEILNLFLSLIRGLPELDDTRDLLDLLTIENVEVKKIDVETAGHEKVKRNPYEVVVEKILKKDISILPLLEKVRSFFTRNLPMVPGTEKLTSNGKELAAQRLSMLIQKTEEYLKHLQNHRQYQERCKKLVNDIENGTQEQIAHFKVFNKEVLRAIFSMIDDVTEKDQTYEPVFMNLLRSEENKDDVISETEYGRLEKVINTFCEKTRVQRYSLFHLENEGIIRNFSFAKQSKFFDIEKDVYFDIVSHKDKFKFKIIYIESAVSLASKFSGKENSNTFCLDEFSFSFSVVYEMLRNFSKGNNIFLGQYSLFDSDRLLDVILDLMAEKLKSRQFTDADVFDPEYLAEMAQQGA